MKKLLIIFLSLLSCHSFSQGAWTCGTGTAPSVQNSASQPSNCIRFLNDFIPTSSENQIEVKVKFWVFKPTSGPGAWSYNTTARALNALRQVDSIWSNLAVNTLSLSGQMVPFIQDTKIKFVMDGPLNIIADDNTYTFTPSAESGTVYNSSTAINVYYGTRYPVGLGAYWSAPFVNQPLPNPHIHFPTADLGSNPPTRDLGDGDHAYILAHELGHVLGLEESSIFNNAVCQGASFINISGGCCNQICADDYVLETNIFWAPCGTPGGSNNMMSENIGCHNYFSPQQMAIMHYNLRTDLRKCLSASGYTAATERTPHLITMSTPMKYGKMLTGILKAI